MKIFAGIVLAALSMASVTRRLASPFPTPRFLQLPLRLISQQLLSRRNEPTSNFRYADSGRGLPQYTSIESGLAARSTCQINSAQISGVLVDAHAEEQNQHVSGVLRTAHGEALIREADHLACQSWSERMKKRAATTVVKPTYGKPRLARTDAADFGSLPKKEYLKFSIAKATHTSA